MDKRKVFSLSLFCVILILEAVVIFFGFFYNPDKKIITFEQCLKIGKLETDGSFQTCVTPHGKTFFQLKGKMPKKEPKKEVNSTSTNQFLSK